MPVKAWRHEVERQKQGIGRLAAEKNSAGMDAKNSDAAVTGSDYPVSVPSPFSGDIFGPIAANGKIIPVSGDYLSLIL